jgi:DNA-binding NtrC family response regulator
MTRSITLTDEYTRVVRTFTGRGWTVVREAEHAGTGDVLGLLRGSSSVPSFAPLIELAAAGTAPVLLTGEPGTGKGRTARCIHAMSSRAARPFVVADCAGSASSDLETELFGVECPSAHTMEPRTGLLEVADGGTIFLDDVGELPLEVQAKVLAVLDTGHLRRQGGTREVPVDVRVIAATHRDLAVDVHSGRFREDLYYRLAACPVRIPSLRERQKADLACIAQRLVADLHRRNPGSPSRITPEALACLTSYAWPGNVRELHNVLERAMLIARKVPALTPLHLPQELRPASSDQVARSDDLSLDSIVRKHILHVLEQANGNRLQAARMLGITRSTLYKRLDEYGVELQRKVARRAPT